MTALQSTHSPEIRRAKILEYLDQIGGCRIEHLVERFNVSGMTIRRDLHDLAAAGKVIRTHGGATAATRVSFDFQFLRRTLEHAAEKEEIARVAASMVQPGDTVMLDSGTTTLAISNRLKAIEGLCVITTSLPIASALFGCENIEVIILGGVLRKESPDLMGMITDHNLDMLNADIAFVGVDAVDLEGNIYYASAVVGRTISHLIQAANKSYAVADHTKINKRDLIRFGHLSEWDGLITDTGLDVSKKQSLENARAVVFQLQESGGQPVDAT